MPSAALKKWQTVRHGSLDEIESAHALIGGSGRGRRFATEQVNHAYAVLLSSQFQGFCRDLHSESVDYLIDAVQPPTFRVVMRAEFLLHRRLDTGNPTPGGIGSDFCRLGLAFWDEVRAADVRTRSRMTRLEALNEWRNAIAHQDFRRVAHGGSVTLQLRAVRSWRRACANLAFSFDRVMRNHIQLHTAQAPWT